MAQSKAEFNKIPEIDFNVTSTGITILGERFYTPRFVPFELKGPCQSCKSDAVEIDYVITSEGVTIYCNRLDKPKFVPYDLPFQTFSNYCLFRVKTRAKIFNIKHGCEGQKTPSKSEFEPNKEQEIAESNMEKINPVPNYYE